MNEQEHDRAERIFLDALASENGERAALVTARCAEDDELKQTVLGLLSAYDEADDFLEIAALDYPLEGDERLAPSEAAAAPADASSTGSEPAATNEPSPPRDDAAGATERPAEDSPVAGRSAHPPQVLEPGTTLGNFTVESAIAFGGMGVVYRAKQARPSRIVALKVLRPSLLEITGRRRFEREAHILARLEHPNIARVFDAGTHGSGVRSLPYFAMEYVKDSTTITTYAIDRNLDTTARLELFLKVCDAVAYGHEHSVIHRDLKPENVLVDVHGQPKVIDFGVARVTDSDITFTNSSSTSAGQFLGTLQYMSPEQCEGDPKKIDERSDVYSLGVLLYELVCNDMPYDVRSIPFTRAILAIQQDQPRPPSAIRSDLNHDLETVILKSLEKKPVHRYESITEFAEDLRRTLHGEPIVGRPATLVRKVSRSRKTRRFAIVALLLAALGGATWAGARLFSPAAFSLGKAIRGSTLSVVSDTEGASVILRRIDPETGLGDFDRYLGKTPLQVLLSDEELTSGQYRIHVVHQKDGSAEFTRYLESEQDTVLTARLHTRQEIEDGMVDVAGQKRPTYQWLSGAADGSRIEVDIPPFLIDRHEVTNAEYRTFADATNHSRPWYLEDGVYKSEWDDFPVAAVEFTQARAYAEWRGKRLPTMLEWELAALGSRESLPIGITADSIGRIAGVGLDPSKNRPEDRSEWLDRYLQYAKPRHYYSEDKSRSGALDMIGNVSEWTESIPVMRSMGKIVLQRYSRTAKGFNWARERPTQQGLEARLAWPTGEFDDLIIGFRCARSLDI